MAEIHDGSLEAAARRVKHLAGLATSTGKVSHGNVLVNIITK